MNVPKRRLSFVMELGYAIKKSERINQEVINLEQKLDQKQLQYEKQTQQESVTVKRCNTPIKADKRPQRRTDNQLGLQLKPSQSSTNKLQVPPSDYYPHIDNIDHNALSGQIQDSIDRDVQVILNRDTNHQISRQHKLQVRPRTTLNTQRSINSLNQERKDKMKAIIKNVRSKMLDFQCKQLAIKTIQVDQMLGDFQKSVDRAADKIVKRIDLIEDVIEDVENQNRQYKKIIEFKQSPNRPKSSYAFTYRPRMKETPQSTMLSFSRLVSSQSNNRQLLNRSVAESINSDEQSQYEQNVQKKLLEYKQKQEQLTIKDPKKVEFLTLKKRLSIPLLSSAPRLSLVQIQDALRKQADYQKMGVQIDAFPKYPSSLNGLKLAPAFDSIEKEKLETQQIIEVSESSSCSSIHHKGPSIFNHTSNNEKLKKQVERMQEDPPLIKKKVLKQSKSQAKISSMHPVFEDVTNYLHQLKNQQFQKLVAEVTKDQQTFSNTLHNYKQKNRLDYEYQPSKKLKKDISTVTTDFIQVIQINQQVKSQESLQNAMLERQLRIKQNSRFWDMIQSNQMGKGISARNSAVLDNRVFKKVLKLVPKTNQTLDIIQTIKGPSQKELERQKFGKWVASLARD